MNLGDFNIQTDLVYNMPNIKVTEKKNVWFHDVAIPGDGGIEEK